MAGLLDPAIAKKAEIKSCHAGCIGGDVRIIMATTKREKKRKDRSDTFNLTGIYSVQANASKNNAGVEPTTSR